MPPTMDYAASGANLVESLRNLRRRVKLLTVAYGAGLVLASAVGLILAVVLLDYLLKLPAGPRAVVNLAALAVLGYAAWICLIRPALRRMTLSDLAGRIENTFPQFDDTLRSTVTFTEQQSAIPGSSVMKQRTVERAAQLAGEVDISKAVALKPVWQSAALGLGALAAFILIAALIDPNLRKIAADRLFAGDSAWPKSTQISMVSQPADRVAAGGDINLSMKLAKGSVTQAVVRYRYDNGPWQQEVVQADGNGLFTTKLKAQLDANRDLSKLQIKIAAGDDEQDLKPVAVVPQLEIRQAIATVSPPAYSKLPATDINLAERPVVAAVGADISLSVTFNKQLDTSKGVRIVPSDASRQAPPAQWTFPRNGQAVGTFNVGSAFKTEDSLKFVVRATDTDGFENTTPVEYQIIVHEDAKPMVVIDDPRQSEDRTPNALIPLRISADDDYGFDSVELVVEGKGPALANREPWIIPLVRNGTAEGDVNWQLSPNSTVERKRYTAEYGWDLGKLAGVTLKPGDKLEFFIRVRDNFDLAGQRHDPVDSSRLTINIISHDQFDAWMENQLSTVRQELASIKKTQDVVKSTTEEQAKETKDRAKLDEGQKATMSRLANQQATAASQTKQSSQKLNDLVKKATENRANEEGPKKAAQEVAKQLDQTAESPMKEATNKLNEAKETKSDPKGSTEQQKQSAEQASKAMENAAAEQKKASEQLDEAMKKLNEFGGLSPAIQNIEKIKKEQEAVSKEYKEKMREALGKKPSDLTPKQKEDLKDLKERQDELSKETEKAIKQMDEKADKMQPSDPAAAKAMKESAQAGKSQSVPQKQSNQKDDNGAAQEMEKNQQANAQQKHKEIELGLDMMLEKLKAAERAKLEQLQKELAEVQALLQALVARQSAHNIDNLLLQDPTGKKIEAITEGDRVALFENAKREIAKMSELKPELGVMTPSQEQTHRNAKDVATKAQALPDTAPAGKIFAAATKMEQAIVHLRATKLVEAYEPPQAEALKNLLEALKLVDEAKKKADDEANQQKEESIKAAYVKILEEQKKIGESTKDIDTNGKDAEGNLKRAAAVELDALPRRQGELSEKAKKLGEQLGAIKSIVYVWANKDIVNSMNDVKSDLSKPQTDLVVQTQQKRIEEQLEAMIKNLAKKPPEPKEFADRGGGGGGGGGKKPPPRMPTDVELNLLRDLQQAVNKATGIIDGEVKKAGGKKDADQLTSLGGRQGELRNLLDQLIKAASEGKVALAPEPKDTDKLPEEAGTDDIEEQEFVKGLLEDNLNADTVEKTVKLVGDRMGRSRQRLALDNDPGKTTQEIQKRIVMDLENLIKLAQQQQQQSGKPKPGDKPGDKPGEPKPGQGEGPQQAGKPGQQPGQMTEGGQQAAQESTMPGQGGLKEDLSKPLKEVFAEWGKISGRDRGAVMDGAGEAPSEKYRKYVEDYYRELGKKASER